MLRPLRSGERRGPDAPTHRQSLLLLHRFCIARRSCVMDALGVLAAVPHAAEALGPVLLDDLKGAVGDWGCPPREVYATASPRAGAQRETAAPDEKSRLWLLAWWPAHLRVGRHRAAAGQPGRPLTALPLRGKTSARRDITRSAGLDESEQWLERAAGRCAAAPVISRRLHWPSRRPLRTTRERAARARADDRDRGRTPAAAVERLVIVLSVAERTPPPPRCPSGHALPMRGRRAARRPPPRHPAARHRRPSRGADGPPQPAPRAPSSPARRPDRLAVYMGCCAIRREGHVSWARTMAVCDVTMSGNASGQRSRDDRGATTRL
jgi:hypothetical protein